MRSTSALLIFVIIPMYVLGVFAYEVLAPTTSEENNVTQSTPVRMTFVGDMMFDRYVRERHDAVIYTTVLENVLPHLSQSEVVFGNLEGPITTFTPVSNWREGGPNHYTFTFATSVASTIAKAGFTAVSLANNHTLNFGKEGLVQTKEWLTQNNITYVGAPDELYIPLRFASTTPQMTVFSYDSWYAHDVQKLTEQIKNEPQDTFVVVYAHWGDEYEKTPNQGQREFAHQFIDAGADFVVGSHPHVIQTKELYKEKWIYYSLGNFVFDQYFSDEVRCGAVITLTIGINFEYTVEEKFIELQRNGTTNISNCAEEVVLEK